MKVYNFDCILGMKNYIKDKSINLIVTSPPYKKEDGFSWELIYNLSNQCYRVLNDDSLCYINFGHLVGNKLRPFEVASMFEKAGFELIDTIIWVKNHYKPIQGKKRVNNLTEFIFQFAKGKNYQLDRLSIGIPYADKSNVGRYSNKDLKCAGNVWHIPYETITNSDQKSHKDRFPVELPRRCIKLSNLKKGDVVLDTFGGSMTTGIACQELGMEFVAFEINEKVFGDGKERLIREETDA